jgi:small-conductance mechanosensitive channel
MEWNDTNVALGRQFNITDRGIEYLESLEEEPYYPVQINHNNISLGNNATAQIQQNTNHSNQTQNLTYSKENIEELFSLLKSDLERLNEEQREELKLEIENAIKQLEKGKDIKSRLHTIGGLIKDIGIEVFVSLVASPIINSLKPILGIPF